MGAGASAEFRDNCAKLTDEEVQELEAKYSALKAKGIKGAGLIEQICVAAQDIKIKSAAEVEEDPAALALARARERVATLTRKVTSEAFSNFLVGTDGAKPSELALEVCLSELMKSKDSITVMHASDPTRDDLGPNMRPQAVRERVEVRLLSTMSKSRYKLMWIEKEKNQKIKTCILHQVNSMTSSRSKLPRNERPSYFVSGITGRKGKNTVGELALLALGNFEIPNIIIKMPPVVDRPRVFVASVKHLSRMEPLHIAIDLMKPGKGDKLIVLHVYKETSYETSAASANVIANYKKLFNNLINADGIDTSGSKFLPIEDIGGKTWDEIVLSALESEKADYVLLNPSIHLGNTIQDNATISNCRKIIAGTESNIVVCNH